MTKSKGKILVVSFQSLTAGSGAGMARVGYYLSAELHKHNLLQSFIVSSKGKFATPFPSQPVSFFSRYYLYVLNKLNKAFKNKTHVFRFVQELLFDWFCAFHLRDDVSIIVTTNSYLYRTFKKAREKGIKIYTIPANPEDNYIYKLVTEEQQKLGLHFTDAYTYKKRLNYYNKSVQLADKIIGTFPVTQETYSKAHPADKIVHIPGHLKPDFKPAAVIQRPQTGAYNVAYLAYTVLLKGLHYLFEAWQEIMKHPGTEQMTLYIGGNIDSVMDAYLKKTFPALKNVVYMGHVSDVPGFLKDKDLFIAPSLIEGGPVTALEAAHYGIPVILTRNCGARDFFEDADSGWVLPIRDAKQIEDSIMQAYNDRPLAAQKGLNAKKKLDNYATENFIQDIANYLIQEHQKNNVS